MGRDFYRFVIRLPVVRGRELDLAPILECMRVDFARVIQWQVETRDYGKIWVLIFEADTLTIDKWRAAGYFPNVTHRPFRGRQ
jgi:hypothetical protein